MLDSFSNKRGILTRRNYIIMDKQRFLQCCDEVRTNGRNINGIGTMGEKSVHATLKLYFDEYVANHETGVGDYVADIVGEHGIIEIQTRSFERLKNKLHDYLPNVRVTVVYPISVNTIVYTVNDDGVVSKRKSPKHGDIYSLFDELYKIREFIDNDNLSVCAMMINTDEFRKSCSRKKSRKGFLRTEKYPTELLDEIYFNSLADYDIFLPENSDEFTAADLAKSLNISADCARLILYTFRDCNIVKLIGKKGRSNLYRRLI